MAKARVVLRALLTRGGCELVHQAGSHRKLRRGDRTFGFAWSESDELGTTQLRKLAKQAGMTLEELKKLL